MTGHGDGSVRMCIECDDVPAFVICEQCEDALCGLCFHWLHKKGRRARHTFHSVHGKDVPVELSLKGTTEHFVKDFQAASKEKATEQTFSQEELDQTIKYLQQANQISYNHLIDKIKDIPLRLTTEERALLKLLEGALEISEYTDKVDVSRNDYGWGYGFYSFSSYGRPNMNDSKKDIIKRELYEVFALISGLYTATNFRKGKQLVTDRSFKDNEEFFQQVFEIGRRFKIMNPDKMRSNYGKMMHLLQDANSQIVLGFSVVAPIKTVYTLLKECNCLQELETVTSEFLLATQITDHIKSKPLLEEFQQKKQAALQTIHQLLVVDKKLLTSAQLELIVHSISDNDSYLSSNSYPVKCTMDLLKSNFSPSDETPQTSLAIQSGRGGSYLSHSHHTQYQFVMQSLMLWHDIQHQMCSLWINTDLDLLDPNNRYQLLNTGQGMNRVQAAPRISRCMSSILRNVQSQLSGWVGLSVVHLGDRDVPNALIFIDKYTQVPRILGPISRAIDNLEQLVDSNEDIKHLIDHEYGGFATSKLVIIRDFFRHGFDGSGDDGGSCVDGRLTSAWNWTSLLEKKEYYHLFKLAGFEGFDGSFKAE